MTDPIRITAPEDVDAMLDEKVVEERGENARIPQIRISPEILSGRHPCWNPGQGPIVWGPWQQGAPYSVTSASPHWIRVKTTTAADTISLSEEKPLTKMPGCLGCRVDRWGMTSIAIDHSMSCHARRLWGRFWPFLLRQFRVRDAYLHALLTVAMAFVAEYVARGWWR